MSGGNQGSVCLDLGLEELEKMSIPVTARDFRNSE